MDFLIVTGMSGAGKTVAVNELEDMGFFCVVRLMLQDIKSIFSLCFFSNAFPMFMMNSLKDLCVKEELSMQVCARACISRMMTSG